MLNLQIDAYDTLFFRDGRPFTMGVDAAATGPFPPHPGVVYGALRAAIATAEGIAKELIPTATHDLEVMDFSLSTSTERYFPAPMDLLIPKNSARTEKVGHPAFLFRPEGDAYLSTGGPSPEYYLSPTGPAEQTGGYLIRETEFRKYLLSSEGDQDYWRFQLVGPDQLFKAETKTGIGRLGFRRIAAPGHLYRIKMVRPLIPVDKGHMPLYIQLSVKAQHQRKHTSTIRLGGEGKLAGIQSIDAPRPLPLPPPEDQFFKLYLKTPAFFKAGIFPDLEKHLKIPLLPISWAIGKADRIAGFDMKNICPKEMRTAVPAGSVFYYRLPNKWTVKEVVEALSATPSLCDFRAAEGFGLYALGTLPFHKLLQS